MSVPVESCPKIERVLTEKEQAYFRGRELRIEMLRRLSRGAVELDEIWGLAQDIEDDEVRQKFIDVLSSLGDSIATILQDNHPIEDDAGNPICGRWGSGWCVGITGCECEERLGVKHVWREDRWDSSCWSS